MTHSEQNVILIVDDIPTNLELLLDFLTEAGFEVLVALDGQAAINQVEYAQPDIILLDVMMPNGVRHSIVDKPVALGYTTT